MDGVISAEFWSNVQLALSVFILGVGSLAFGYYSLQGRNYIQDKQIQQVIKQVVLYVEQVYGSEAGQLKKSIAVQAVQDRLDELGIKLDVDYLAMLIESVVFEELNRWKFDDENSGFSFSVGTEIDPSTVQLETE